MAAAAKYAPSLLGSYRRSIGLIVMIMPCLAYFLIFHYVPMVGLIIAFKDFVMTDGVLGSRWIGLESFERLFSSADFPRALRNTIVISLLRLSFGFVAPIVLALMLNELRISWHRRTVQTLTYIPYVFSWVMLGGIFLMMFSDSGPINQMVQSVSDKPIKFLVDDFWFIILLTVTYIWQSAGYGAVIYLAALSGINPDLYEAAVVDGANRWRQTLHITLPCLVPTIIVLFILNIGHFLTAGFDQVYNLYNPMVYDISDIVDTYVLRRLQLMDFSLATAAGLFKSAVGLGLVVAVNFLARRFSDGEHGIW